MDNTAAWTVSTPLPGGAASVAVVGADGDRVVVALAIGGYGGDTKSVYVVDTTARTVAWSKDGFLGAAVTGGSVVGVEEDSATRETVTALSVADGNRRWSLPNTRYETKITYIGPKLVAVEGRDYANGHASFQLVDGDTGTDAVPAAISAGGALWGTYNMKCLWDRRAVTVCSGVGIVMGLDATTGRELWRLPDQAAGRVAPSVTAAWHGAVYGTASGPVVLDAATGRDLATPDITPVLVSAHTAVTVDPSGKVRAHRATG